MKGEKNADNLSKGQLKKINETNKRLSGNINKLLDGVHQAVYGTTPKHDVDELDRMLDNVLSKELSSDKASNMSITNFMNDLVTKQGDVNRMMSRSGFGSNSMFNLQSAQSLMTDAYRNRMLLFNDLHETSSNLNELREAILITRDAITSPDIVEGHISRTLSFNDTDDEDSSGLVPIVKKMEEKFELQHKIKNFITVKTLEYGEYYAYIVPYAKIFSDFEKDKDSLKFESTDYPDDDITRVAKMFTESTAAAKTNIDEKKVKGEIKSLLSNISIVTEGTIPGVEYMGLDIEEFKEAIKTEVVEEKTLFEKVETSGDGIGIYDDGSKSEFKDIKDCYIKFMTPTELIPVKIMDYTIGYYYIHSQDALNGSNIDGIFVDKFTGGADRTLASEMANLIVKSFNKKFLNENIKFKELIANAISYHNLYEKKITFQFIPADQVACFKIDVDENGEGTSIITPSLFYAKLYLMLLLFKLLTVVMNSNDTRVHYIPSSGIDKDIANKVENIARKMQQRQINILDMFSYTTLINKVGQGSELFVPTGKNGARPIETEILAGQDVQMNTDIMEMLKTSYISATGVPSVIMNYINEADFAKTLELANTRFQGRVVSHQLDFNKSITNFYRMILANSTSIDKDSINNFKFTFPAPKYASNTTNTDMINNFETLSNFIINNFIDMDEAGTDSNLKTAMNLFKRKLATERMPSLGLDRCFEMFEESLRESGLDELIKKAKGSANDDAQQ